MPSHRRPLIGQDILADYYALAESARRMKELREELMTLLDAGADVESGDFDVQVRECKCVSLTRKSVTESLGEDAYEALRSQVEPTITRQLIVRRSQ